MERTRDIDAHSDVLQKKGKKMRVNLAAMILLVLAPSLSQAKDLKEMKNVEVTVQADRKLGTFRRELLGVCIVPWNEVTKGLEDAMRPILRGSSVRIWGKDDRRNLDRWMPYVRKLGVKQVVLFPIQEGLQAYTEKGKRAHYAGPDDHNLTHGQLPETLAEWVRYAHKERREGFPEGYGVRYFEVWNEPFWSNFGSWNPEDYARYVGDCARAVRRVDSDVKIGAHFKNELPTTITQLPAKTDWNARFAKAVDWSCVDFVVPHYYNNYSSFVKGCPSEYHCLVGGIERNRTMIRCHRKLITKHAPKRKIEMVVSEWNIHPLRYGDPSHVTRDMAAAIHVASALQMYAEEGVDSAQFFQLWSGKGQFGMLGDGQGKVRRPTYQVFRLYAEHTGVVRVETAVNCPTFDWVNPHNPKNERWQVRYLDCMGTLGKDGQTLHLIMVNKHPEQAAGVHVNVRGFAAKGNALLTTLTADKPTSEKATLSNSKKAVQTGSPRFTIKLTVPQHSITCVDLQRE
jgi:hypothetical protein